MKTFFTFILALLGLSATAQNITYRQLVPLSNYVDSVYALANAKVNTTNGALVGGVSFGYLASGGSPYWRLLTTNSPDPTFGVSASFGWGIFGENGEGYIGYSYLANNLYVADSSMTLTLRGNNTIVEGNLQTVQDFFLAGNGYISGNLFDAVGDRFITTLSGSNNVRVIAGSGVTVAGAPVAANIFGYTVTAVGGSGASNAVNLITTNNVILSSGTTGLSLTNSADIVPAGYSNNSTAFIFFSITPAFKLQFTNLIIDATNTLAAVVQPASTNLSNWANLSTNAILAAASNRVAVLAGSNATVVLTSTNGTNFYTVSGTASGGGTVVATGTSFTNPAFYLDSTANTYQFRGRPVSTYAQTMLFRSPGGGDSSQLDQRMSWSFNDTTTPDFSFNVLTNTFVFNYASANSLNNDTISKVLIVTKDQKTISLGYLHNFITNEAALVNKSNVNMSAKMITNVANLNYTVFSGTVSGATNLTVNMDTNKQYWTLSLGVTLTNFNGIATGKGSDTTLILLPSGANRGVVYPTLGGNSFGIHAFTNANSPMWTTLTQNIAYAVSISAFGTNTFWAITEWK